MKKKVEIVVVVIRASSYSSSLLDRDLKEVKKRRAATLRL